MIEGMFFSLTRNFLLSGVFTSRQELFMVLLEIGLTVIWIIHKMGNYGQTY